MEHRIIKKRERVKASVGAFIIIALVLAAFGIIVIGTEEGFLKSKYTLKMYVNTASGLQSGSPVWLAGYRVGTVSSVDFSPDISSRQVQITLKISSLYRKWIRKDSVARIGTLGLLGDKYVGITLGSPEYPVLSDGEVIRSENPLDFEQMVAHGADAFDDLKLAASNLKDLSIKLNKGKGTLGKLINDPEMYYLLNDLSKNITYLAKSIRESKGTFGLLMRDTTLYWSLVDAAASANAVMDSISGGEGSVGALLRDPELYQNLLEASESLNDILEYLKMPQGTAGAFINDPTLYNDIEETVKNLNELIEDIRNNPRKYIKIKVF
ncbi:MAG: hypothetical protein B6D65_03035 [candidate division Zixibacteria bacterium 4484_93]|nr:MAG: hypothetical protein B6D65_03035 [candidate division Zixibacteria bacterium 4484_93]